MRSEREGRKGVLGRQRTRRDPLKAAPPDSDCSIAVFNVSNGGTLPSQSFHTNPSESFANSACASLLSRRGSCSRHQSRSNAETMQSIESGAPTHRRQPLQLGCAFECRSQLNARPQLSIRGTGAPFNHYHLSQEHICVVFSSRTLAASAEALPPVTDMKTYRSSYTSPERCCLYNQAWPSAPHV